jgi:hypothetical protein
MGMEHSDADWRGIVEQLGGAGLLEQEARDTKAFERPREVKCAVDLLRFIFAYCLGKWGLRLTAAWAEGIGLASISNVALLGRLRNAVPWLERIAARLIVNQNGASHKGATPGKGRRIRLFDATTVVKAGTSERENGGVWRIHAAYDLPEERLSAFVVTDEKGAEAINRIAVVPGEIRLADRVHCRAEPLADVIAQGADVVVRAGWRSARWLSDSGCALDIIGLLQDSANGIIDIPVKLARTNAEPLRLRCVAVRIPKDKAMKAVADARATAKRKGHQIDPGTLVAAEWVIMVTSLPKAEFSTQEVLDIYRLRWRIEIAFKRMKSLIGLKGPPGKCAKVAKVWVLCHLIAVLLTEAQLSAIGDSPRRAPALAPACGAPAAC